MPHAHSSRRALLVIDMQVGLFHGPGRPHDGERVLSNVQALIRKARDAGAPIFAARHTGPAGSPLDPAGPLAQLLPELGVDPNLDTVFDKTRPSCFAGTRLAHWLSAAGIAEIVVAGMKTQYCVDATCRAASEIDIRPILVADAHTCMDTPALPAASIVAHHNLTLDGPFATLTTADTCSF